jgi:TonB-linked SusC/RagA family outer membrane protein
MNYIKIWMAFCGLFLCVAGNVHAQNANEVTIKSTVYDDQGQPVAGALVAGNEGKTVAYTDLAGQLSITVRQHSVIVITANGFKMQTLKVDAMPKRVTLTKENNGEEVNVAFRKVNKQDINGGISVLNPDTYIEQDYNTSVPAGINGRVAGLLGSNNIWGLENAIVMIDGVQRSYSDISLSEVQQITVLKGINAVALYGSQAAKGVILVTTKKGEANTKVVNVHVNTGIATPVALPNYLNSADYMTLYNEGRRNDGLANLYDSATIQNYRTGNAYRFPSVDYYSSDYVKSFLNSSSATAEFSGGNNTARFYSNIGWSNSSTLLKVGEGSNESDSRLNMRGNIDLKLNDFISSTLDVSAVFGESRRGHGNYWNSAATMLPNKFAPLIPLNMIAPYDAASLGLANASRNIINGQYILGGTQQIPTNTLADYYVGGHDSYISRLFQVTNAIDVNLSHVLTGLSFHTKFNLDYINSYTQSINNGYSIYTPTFYTSLDSMYVSKIQQYGTDSRSGTQNINNTAVRQNIGFSGQFNYDRSIKDVHNISVILLGYTSSITNNDIYQPTTNAHVGLQASYNYKHKYWADFTGAYVNSTKLPAGNRGGLSPTVSLGWLLSSERFLSSAKSLDYLKLSASAGVLKTDLDISGYYLYDNIYTQQSYYSWNDALYQNRATGSLYGASPNLAFPERKEFNATLQGSFLKNFLTFQSTFFVTTMNGLATQRFSQYPNYFSSFIPYTNYNANKRTGIDLALGLNKKLGAVDFSIGVNATYTTSKVSKRDELYLDPYQNRTGKPVDAIFGLVNEGFFADQSEIDKHARQMFSEVKPGDIKYVDQNKDGIIDSRDEVMIGRWIAPLNYGINLSAAYKNFNLFVLATGSNGGNGVRNNSYYWVAGDAKYSNIVLNRWTPATKATATFPRLSSLQNANDFRYSDFWIYSSDRVDLAKVQLTYDVAVKKSIFKDLGLYISGANLLTIAKNKDILTLAVASAPQMRYYNVGVRAKF